MFFRQSTIRVAREILGGYLVREHNGSTFVGRIVEAEAYLHNDPACHAYRGMTDRTRVMFGQAGLGYIYFTYGMHHCFNIVTNEEGIGEAVLIRALEPVKGTEEMYALREKAKRDVDLLSGPGKICQAFSLTRSESGVDLIESDTIFLEQGKLKKNESVGVTSRIGLTVAVEKPWRFFIKDNPFVSKGRPSDKITRSV
jgi:DNA-3-methyladenine glycosylase